MKLNVEINSFFASEIKSFLNKNYDVDGWGMGRRF